MFLSSGTGASIIPNVGRSVGRSVGLSVRQKKIDMKEKFLGHKLYMKA